MVSRPRVPARWALVGLATLAAACSGGPGGRPERRATLGMPAPPGTYRIGVAGPFTGQQARAVQAIENGVRLAVDEWRAANPGHAVEVLVGDDRRDPGQAVAVARKFAADGVVGVIGHYNSSASIPASEVYRDHGIVQLTPSSSSPRFTQRGLWNVFRVTGRDDRQGEVAAAFLAGRGLTRAAILHDGTTYGKGVADAFRDSLEKDYGVEPVFYGGVAQGDKDFSATLARVKAADPEVLYFGGIYPEGGLLARQMKDLGIRARFMSGDGVIDPEFVKIAGKDAAEGARFTLVPDARGVARQVPAAREMAQAYERRFDPIGIYSLHGYVAAKVLLDALEAVGAASAKDGERVADYIRRTPWDTALGRLEFDQNGDITRPLFVVYETRGGDFVQITDFSTSSRQRHHPGGRRRALLAPAALQ